MTTPGPALAAVHVAELASFLQFISEWAAADQDRLSDSLTRFMHGHPYGIETLRHDLTRFRSLLGDDACSGAGF
jgi:hypothetical protein